MNATVRGHLASVKKKLPEENDNFKAHLSLRVTENVNGEIEMYKIKDYDLGAVYKEGTDFNKKCRFSAFKGFLGCSVVGA